MKGALVTAAAAAFGVVAVIGPTPAEAACKPATNTIKGHQAYVYCGPAAASLRIGGKSYDFKGGTCIWSGSTLILDVGTQVNGVPTSANNEGEPLLGLNGSGLATAYAFSGRLHLGMSIVKLTLHGHSSGTFTGREPVGATLRFSGAFHC
jgi:hypothetical protein